MRLINVETFATREFLGKDIPAYAILSHTWDDDEVSLSDIQDLPKARQMKGFGKIEYLCKQAAQDGWEWAWADTCCIDKTSSAELTEAINSMFKWYGSAMVCYAYLNDVASSAEWSQKTSRGRTAVNLPRWFTRGWTLQELIAPLKVHFYTSTWELLGSKASLQDLLSIVTGISSEILNRDALPTDVPVATRMHWASLRNTTREEDVAYCLLGLFSVNMPLLYGEGSRAFERLQEHILKTTEDHTIFLTQPLTRIHTKKPENQIGIFVPRNFEELRGRMLAHSPADFKEVCQFQPVFTNFYYDPQLMVRDRGLKVSLRLKLLEKQDLDRLWEFMYIKTVRGSIYMGALNCIETGEDGADDEPKWTPGGGRLGQAGFSSLPMATTAGKAAVIFLLRLTSSRSETTMPIFVRLQPFYHLVPRTETKKWDFSTCSIVSMPHCAWWDARLTIDLSDNPFYIIDRRISHQSHVQRHRGCFFLLPKLPSSVWPSLSGIFDVETAGAYCSVKPLRTEVPRRLDEREKLFEKELSKEVDGGTRKPFAGEPGPVLENLFDVGDGIYVVLSLRYHQEQNQGVLSARVQIHTGETGRTILKTLPIR